MKRLFDLLVSFIALVILSPVIMIVCVLSLIILGWPVFFVQVRPGYKGRLFKMIKFRTMLNTKDSEGNLLDDQHRMTRFGSFLRKTSLDELPELINVFLGHMSLVGPRPLLVEYLPLYSAEQARRHDVRPGITGLAQISGRNNLPWEQRFELDVYYVDHRSFLMDLKILVGTVGKVLGSKDIEQAGHVTAAKFSGTKKG